VDRCYLDAVVTDHILQWLRFTSYFDARELQIPLDIHAPDVAAYLEQIEVHRSASRLRFVRASLRIFLETDDRGHFRRRIGGRSQPVIAWAEPALSAYRVYCEEHRGLADHTASKRMWQLSRFAEHLERSGVRKVSDIGVGHIRTFLTELHVQAPATRRTYGVTLRSFLRWAFLEGVIKKDLRAAAITVRQYRQAGVRDVLREEEVAQILSVVDRTSRIGRRDYAVLLLAARYGLRPSDIRQLCLDDVHWRQGVLAIQQAKTGRPLILPLLPDILAALTDYLQHGRPTTEARHIFVRHRAPFEPFVPTNNLAAIMRTALRRAGLDQRPGRRGLYLFRHTLATRLQAADCPIKMIGDVLGHASSDTTREYATVDLGGLRRVVVSEAEVHA
ncbi:MAG: tyrosine-type recombinase/integrase, partial [Nitrospirae bacterium]|nr:tyrosine-type recombinase/integrase [Nitrospirota bacterium]